MTDTDNTGASATAGYGDISLKRHQRMMNRPEKKSLFFSSAVRRLQRWII
ncbi:hypothetical protein [Desulfosarcina ovata]|nr:hypothetical protein [Desulfosarcina ovata]